jgi:phosphoglycerol transferase
MRLTNRPAAHSSPSDPASPPLGTSGTNDITIGGAEAILAAAMVAVFVFLLFRNLGLHPSVFSDEWSYSMSSRLMKLRSASTPLYFYYFVYRLTRHCGIEFLECARVLNALFFVAAAPLIYAVARKVASKPVAVLVALLSLFGPINTYTAYFLPEAMYFFVFWILTWFALSDGLRRPARYGAAAGFLLALLMLIKVNAIFLVPGVAVFIVYRYLRDNSPSGVRSAFTALGYMIFTAAVVRLCIGYLCAGTAGLHVLGTKYGSLAASSLGSSRFTRMTGATLGVLLGHAMGLAVLFGVPLAAMVALVFRRGDKSESDGGLQAIAAYSLALIVVLLIVVAYFTTSVIGEGPYESLARLHMRYYNFLFPLFLIVVAGQVPIKGGRRNPYVTGISVAVLVGFIIYALKSLLRLYSPSIVDSPELYGVTAGKVVFVVVAILGILSMIVWAWDQRRGAQLFLFVFMPVSVLCSTTIGNSYLRGRLKADSYDRAGVFARDELEKDERSKLVVVGSELASLYRALFYIDDPDAAVLAIAPGAPLDRSAISGDREWVLVMGDHPLPTDVVEQSSGDGYVLFRLPEKSTDGRAVLGERTIDFTHPFRFGLVKRVSGLSVSQPFGRWSDSRVVQIELFRPLPRWFDLCLTASAFGPNVQLPFEIGIGGEDKVFRLSSTPSEICLPFNTSGGEILITIGVPQPISPKQLGVGSDDRMLGIALTKMKIIPAEPR